TVRNSLYSKPAVLAGLHVFFFLAILSIDTLDYPPKVALFAFLSAMTLWVTTKMPAGFVAISLIGFVIIMKAAEPDLLYTSLSEQVIWLMIGSFIIGNAVKESGLAERLVLIILSKSKKKGNVLAGINAVIVATVFFIPSTSGRAALAMPIINQLSKKYTEEEQRVLVLLAPLLILMSTSATFIGAGSHLIGIGLLESTAQQSISFIQWFIWGLPFAIVMTIVSFFVVKWTLWPKNGGELLENSQIAELSEVKKRMNPIEKKTLLVLVSMIAFWMTVSIHGYDIAIVAMVGAIFVMAPTYGIISWKQGMKSVSWN